jgi:hypothetical protein
METKNATIAVFADHEQAEAAIRSLQNAGIDMKHLSIVGKDFHTEEHALGFYNLGDRMKFWGKLGAFWGTIGAMLFGSALLFIPVVGHVIVLGPLVSTFVEALEGAALGGSAGLFGGALFSIGIPKDSVVRYEREVKAGHFLVVAQGSAAEVETARSLLAKRSPMDLAAHASPATA